MNQRRTTFYQRHGKRYFDVSAGLAIGVATLPIQAIVGVIVARTMGRPVLFRQVRPGRNARPFEILKFRTMTDATGPGGNLLPDEARLTRFGKFLRSTSLDELPELYNVIRGDMSLVGPRPLLMQYVDRYSEFERRRHEVRPGLTGLAQVNGRNEASWAEKFGLDVTYVDNVTFLGDLRILFATIRPVVTRTDISQTGHASTPEFFPTHSHVAASESRAQAR